MLPVCIRTPARPVISACSAAFCFRPSRCWFSNGVPRTRTAALFEEKTLAVSREKWRRIWPWVLANALAGQTLGVTCMQWALEQTNAAIVAAIIALTPIFLLPMTRIFEGEKIGVRSLVGALVAVGGVIGLTFFR